MKFKYITNQTEDSAEILIHKGIEDGLSERVSEEISFLVNVFGIKKLFVRVNSGGGSMLEGFGIFTSLFNAIEKGVEVITVNEGVAASMGGLITQMGTTRRMVDFGLLMLHNPNFNGDSARSPEEQAVINKFKESALTMFEGNTGIDRKELEKMMEKETWLDASQAKELGFVDEIIITGQKHKKKRVKNLFKSGKTVDLTAVMNAINIDNQDNFKDKKDLKTKTMLKEVTNFLKLQEDANEESVLNAIKAISTKVDTVTNENSTLKEDITAKTGEIETLTNKVADFKKLDITKKVENAIIDGIFTKDSKDEMVSLGIKDESQLDLILGSIKKPESNLMNQLNDLDGKVELTPKKTLRELEKEDPKMVLNLMENNLTEYKRLYKEQYNTEYKG